MEWLLLPLTVLCAATHVELIFYREPSDRIELREIMAHPWLSGVETSSPPVLCRKNISEALHQSVIDTMIEG